eukprot:TRINITY_DN3538_c0_g1_i1.p1 TRINITY_DN3538_c0_g1~~TRINITY_DN3538_c0_g1_i1.p1  ORF type:complete len:113 (-),score=13.80 TRINITY_DN3538_c0_g1_i1:75-413(-)
MQRSVLMFSVLCSLCIARSVDYSSLFDLDLGDSSDYDFVMNLLESSDDWSDESAVGLLQRNIEDEDPDYSSDSFASDSMEYEELLGGWAVGKKKGQYDPHTSCISWAIARLG